MNEFAKMSILSIYLLFIGSESACKLRAAYHAGDLRDKNVTANVLSINSQYPI